MRWMAMLCAGILAAACSESPQDRERADRLDRESREQAWIEKGKDAVRAKLKDGPSARFRSVYFSDTPDGPPVACGEVNAKNSLGAYGGFQRFLSAGRSDLTFLEEETPAGDFQPVWDRFCD